MKNILYVYGYGSNANDSNAVKLFRKAFDAIMPGEYNMICIDYPQDDCAAAIRTIKETIEKNNIDLVIGSSLGGFITLCLDDVCRFVINPCMKPSVELPKLGAPQDLIDTYIPYEDKILHNDLINKEIVVGFFGDHDELLGDRYHQLFRKHFNKFIPIHSEHHVSEDAVNTIISYMGIYWDDMQRVDAFLFGADNI